MAASTVVFPTFFVPGFQEPLGENLNTAATSAMVSVQDTITATASGTQANAFVLKAIASRVNTVGTSGDSVQIPFAVAGMQRIIRNDSATSLTVYSPVGNNPATGTTDTINGTAGATGVAVAGNKQANFICFTNGAWVGPVALA